MQSAPQSIFLVGMMGVGKSTIGRLLAEALCYRFIDTDREIELRSGVLIPTIFEIEGEEGFRKREALIIEELSQERGMVLATGGGAVLLADNRRHLVERGLVIYLRAGVDEIFKRTRRDKSRPLLQTDDPRARIEQLLTEREPLYASIAQLAFQSAAANPKRLVARIVAHPRLAELGISRAP